MFLADSDHFTLNILSSLEKFVIQKALDANRYDVDNKTVPKCKISEYDMPLAQKIYEGIEFIMATLGYRMNVSTVYSNQKNFSASRRGIVAYGTYSGESFELLPDSEINCSKAVNLGSYNAKRKSLLFDGGIAQKADGKYYLTKVISFRTPSGASDFILGGSTNGWIEWRDKDGKTLYELFRTPSK